MKIQIPNPELKETFAIKLRPSVKQLLIEICKKSKLSQEDILKAGIFYIQKEYEKKIKEFNKKNIISVSSAKPKIINPYPRLVKRKS